jgi:hypothetical protein
MFIPLHNFCSAATTPLVRPGSGNRIKHKIHPMNETQMCALGMKNNTSFHVEEKNAAVCLKVFLVDR